MNREVIQKQMDPLLKSMCRFWTGKADGLGRGRSHLHVYMKHEKATLNREGGLWSEFAFCFLNYIQSFTH